MRYLQVTILLLLFSSCFDRNSGFDKKFYEEVTGIKFPLKYKVLDTYDNGEFLTGTIFQFDSTTMKSFVTQNHFDTLKETNFHFFNINLFDKKFQPQKKERSIFLIIWKSKGKRNWTYLADVNTNRLWTEINYPDWANN